MNYSNQWVQIVLFKLLFVGFLKFKYFLNVQIAHKYVYVTNFLIEKKMDYYDVPFIARYILLSTLILKMKAKEEPKAKF